MCMLRFLPEPVKTAIRSGISAFAPEKVTLRGSVVYLNPDDAMLSGLMALGMYERREVEFFSKYCKPGMTVVDVGANVGAFSALALRQSAPGGRVVSIEPHPESRKFLTRTVEANLNPTVSADIIPMAAAAAEGETQLFLNPNNKADNRLFQSEETPEAITVQLRTIDAILADLGVSQIDFLKTDAQGADFEALKGARETLERSPKMVILSEFWPEGIATVSGEPARNYLEYLNGLGFALYTLGAGAAMEPLGADDYDALSGSLTGTDYVNIAAFKGWDGDPRSAN